MLGFQGPRRCLPLLDLTRKAAKYRSRHSLRQRTTLTLLPRAHSCWVCIASGTVLMHRGCSAAILHQSGIEIMEGL